MSFSIPLEEEVQRYLMDLCQVRNAAGEMRRGIEIILIAILEFRKICTYSFSLQRQ